MDPLDIMCRYYDLSSALYRTLLSHSVSVASKALGIVCSRPELGLDATFVYESSLLHDVGIFMCDAPEIGCCGEYKYICHGYLGADLLRDLGYDRHALVCERHTGTGLSLEMIERQGLPVPYRDMRPVTLEEQLICYADKFFSKTHLGVELPVDRIRLKLSRYGSESVRQFDEWRELFEGGTEKVER